MCLCGSTTARPAYWPAVGKRQGEADVERAIGLFADGVSDEGLLWAARGLERMERNGAAEEDQWEARMLLSLWGQRLLFGQFPLPADTLPAPPPAIAPDGTVFAAAPGAEGVGVLRRYDPVTRQRIAEYPFGQGAPLHYWLSGDGRRVCLRARAAPDGESRWSSRLFDVQSGRLVVEATLPNEVHPDDAFRLFLVPGESVGRVRVRDLDAGTAVEIDTGAAGKYWFGGVQFSRGAAS